MPDPSKTDSVYRAIASNLKDFGYSDVSAHMIREIHEAINADDQDLPTA